MGPRDEVAGERDDAAGRGLGRRAGAVELGVGTQEAAEEGHVERGADSLVADVAEREGDPAVLQGEGVVEVARDLASGMERGRDLPAGRLRQGLGQKLGLDLPSDLELPLELARAVPRGVLEPLLLERRRDAGPQDDGVERLGKVVRRAELDGPRDGARSRRRRRS